MRLLLLTENYPPNSGGMSQSCDRLVNSFRANKVEVDVLHFTNKNTPFLPIQKINGLYIAIPKPHDMAHGLNVALSYIEHHLDISSYSHMFVFGGNMPVTAAPVYSTLLGLDYYLCLRGNDFDISLFDSKRRVLLNSAINQAKGVFVGSYDKINRLNKLYPNVPAYYTPSGINLDDWQAFDSEQQFAIQWRNENILENQIVIGLIGFLKTKKGVRFFLNALLKSNYAKRIHLLLSGEQPEEILELISEYEISYTQIPHTGRFNLIKHLLTCDWVAIPSYYEGMPNVMLEAGGLGIPVIASAVDGMRDMIEHDVNGLLFRPIDVNDCAKQISKIVNMPQEQRRVIGNALKEKIKNEYTPENEVNRYLQVMHERSTNNIVNLTTDIKL